jgi:two-component system, LytTR family, sensor histidine kinase AlgZ
VENAIHHGIEPLPSGGMVNILITQDKGGLQFTTSNALVEQRPYQQRSGNKMAQDNIRQRLKLAYGNKSTMDIIKTDKLYTISFSIPLGVQP